MSESTCKSKQLSLPGNAEMPSHPLTNMSASWQSSCEKKGLSSRNRVNSPRARVSCSQYILSAEGSREGFGEPIRKKGGNNLSYVADR